MQTAKPILLFFFLFLIISISKAEAFEYFNYNPTFASDINGYNIVDSSAEFESWYCLFGYCFGTYNPNNTFSCFNYQWNSTNNSIQIDSLGSCNWSTIMYYTFLSIKPMSTASFEHTFNTSNLYDLDNIQKLATENWNIGKNNSDYLLLPKNKEGIIFVWQGFNNTNNVYNVNTQLKIYIDSSLYSSTALTSASNVTVSIPAMMKDRKVQIYLDYQWGNGNDASVVNPIHIEIKQFRFMTFDKEDTLPSAFTDEYVKTACNSTATPDTFLDKTMGTNGVIKVAFERLPIIVANPNITCAVYQLNSSVIVRQYLNMSDTTNPNWLIARDIALFGGNVGGNMAGLQHPQLFTQLAPYTVKVSCSNDTTYAVQNNWINFSGSGSFNLNNTYEYCYNNGGYKVNININSSSGNKYKAWQPAKNSNWYPIYQTTCENGLLRCSSNILQVQSSDCQWSDMKTCTLGCNADNSDCNYPLDFNGNEIKKGYGAYCWSLFDGSLYPSPFYYVINSSTSSPFTQSCPSDQYCIQQSSVNYAYIGCSNLTTINGTIVINKCYDSTGAEIDCAFGVSKNQGTQTSDIASMYGTNLFDAISLSVGSIFNMGTMQYIEVDRAMTSIFTSLFLSISISMFIAFKKSEFSEKIFSYSFLGFLSMFTIGLNNIYLWAVYIVIIIITAGIMSGSLKKLFGGE